MSRIWLSSSVVLLSILSAVGVVHGQDYVETELVVSEPWPSQSTAEAYQQPAIAMDADGDFVVSWAATNGWGIWFQRFARDGAALGTNTRVEMEDYAITPPDVAMDEQGGFVIAWNGDPSFAIWAQRFDAGGTALGAPLRVSDQQWVAYTQPRVGMDGQGGFVVAWWAEHDRDVYVQRFDSGGQRVGDNVKVNDGGWIQPGVSLAVAPGGDFVVVTNPEWSVRARRYAADGTALGPSFQVDQGGFIVPPFGDMPHLEWSVSAHDVAVAADGTFAVTWMVDRGYEGLRYRLFDASGAPLAPEQILTDWVAGQPAIAVDGFGTWTATWNVHGDYDAWQWKGYTRRFDSDGALLGDPVLALTQGWLAYHWANDVAAADDGTYAVAYFSDGAFQIYTQLYTAPPAAGLVLPPAADRAFERANDRSALGGGIPGLSAKDRTTSDRQ